MIPVRITALVLAASCAVAPHSFSQEAEKQAPVGLYKLKNRSAFNSSEQSRAPFWPIGHVKRVRQGNAPVVDAGPRMTFSPEMFNVTSIVLGNPSLAIINGRAYGEGEFLRLSRGPRTKGADDRNRIRVTRIVDGVVTLQSADGQAINVPLKRPELNERKIDEEEQLLLDDR